MAVKSQSQVEVNVNNRELRTKASAGGGKGMFKVWYKPGWVKNYLNITF